MRVLLLRDRESLIGRMPRLFARGAWICTDKAGAVLEIGSATGLDADLLEARGLRVHRTDATRAFVIRLRDRGMPAQVLKVITDELGGPWDGIYANAVFLHLDVGELTAVLGKTAAAVRPGGVLGFTLKEGDGAGWTTEKLGDPATSATGGNPV